MSNQQFLQVPAPVPAGRRERVCRTCRDLTESLTAFPLPPLPPPPPPPLPSYALEFACFIDFPRKQQSEALEHQSRLKDEFSRLVHALNKDDQSKAMDAINMHLQGLDAVLSNLLAPQTYNERKAPDSTVALRTFAVPELLELVLDQLNIRDLLTMYLVSRTMCDAIDNSSKLQVKLALRPKTACSHFRAPFQYEQYGVADGFTCGADFYPGIDDDIKQSMPIRANFYLFSGQKLAKLAPRCRRMFICQPPPTEMAVSVRCCGEPWPATAEQIAEAGSDYRRRFERKIVAAPGSDGLTIGDLYDCAAKVVEAHRYCPHASRSMLDEFGFVNAGVSFKGHVPLCVGDPIIEEKERAKAATQAMCEKSAKERSDRRAYTNAKRAAHRNGLPIPTLEEFLAEREGRGETQQQQPSADLQLPTDAAADLPDSFANLPNDFSFLPDPFANLTNS